MHGAVWERILAWLWSCTRSNTRLIMKIYEIKYLITYRAAWEQILDFYGAVGVKILGFAWRCMGLILDLHGADWDQIPEYLWSCRSSNTRLCMQLY